MKKLLQINTVINSGSTGHIAEEIGQLAIQRGWESYIAYGRNERRSDSIKIKIGNKQSVYLHVLKTRLFDKHGFGSKKATKRFIREIELIKPDIIHLHNIHGYYINIELLFNYLSGLNIPIVWTLHDCWSFTGHCAHFEYVKCAKWKQSCHSCPQKSNYPASRFCDNSKNNQKAKRILFTSVSNITIVSVSKWLNNLISNSFLSNYTRKIIYNGINTNIFFPRSSHAVRATYSIKESDFMIIGVASTWDYRKGLSDFIHLSQLIDAEIKIVLVGVADKQKKLLPKNIIAINRTENQEKLAELYSIADVVLNLSYEESFGLTTVEGFACGTPSIVYNCTASPELITDETGFVVEANDFQGIIRAINTIKEKGKSYYSESCKKRVADLYDKDTQYNKYIDLYEEILNANSNP